MRKSDAYKFNTNLTPQSFLEAERVEICKMWEELTIARLRLHGVNQSLQTLETFVIVVRALNVFSCFDVSISVCVFQYRISCYVHQNVSSLE